MLNIKKIRPIYNQLVTTANRYEEDNKVDGIITDFRKTEGDLKEYQTVVSVGSSVREVKVGEIVLINPARYIKRKFDSNSLREDIVDNPAISIDIPTVEIDRKDYLLINESDIAYVIEESEEIKDTPHTTTPVLITPKPTKIML